MTPKLYGIPVTLFLNNQTIIIDDNKTWWHDGDLTDELKNMDFGVKAFRSRLEETLIKENTKELKSAKESLKEQIKEINAQIIETLIMPECLIQEWICQELFTESLLRVNARYVLKLEILEKIKNGTIDTNKLLKILYVGMYL